VNALFDREVVFFGGKGGVGKTTCSSAFALAASRRGKHVLLVSTDPAHSTSDIFEQPIGPGAREIAPRLFALEIDAEREAARYVRDVKRDIERMFAPSVVRQAYRQIDVAAASPGLGEMALLDRMVDLIVSRETAGDLVVFDTAPTGHTLQLLRMPEVMDTWIHALMKHRRAVVEIDRGHDEGIEPAGGAADPVLAALERRHERVKRLRRSVLDRGRTAFVLVTIPERLAIEETARAAELLADTGIDVAALVVNRVLPDEVVGEFFRSRKEQEKSYLEEIGRRFGRLPRVAVRQLPRDIHGLAGLQAISDQLVGRNP
jgi:arsenite-transporting ATPase